jgi:hypothetical protein
MRSEDVYGRYCLILSSCVPVNTSRVAQRSQGSNLQITAQYGQHHLTDAGHTKTFKRFVWFQFFGNVL